MKKWLIFSFLIITILFNINIPGSYADETISKTFDKASPLLYMEAESSSGVIIDGIFNYEWDFDIPKTGDLLPIEEVPFANLLKDSVTPSNIGFKLIFRYNTTYLFGGLFIACSTPPMEEICFIFFGRTGIQDAIHIDLVTNITQDMTFSELGGDLTPDPGISSITELYTNYYSNVTGTYIEFAKKLQSTSDEGDIDLSIGDSIAVSIFAWKGPGLSESDSPNYGTAENTTINYIHLSIGERTDEDLDNLPQATETINWVFNGILLGFTALIMVLMSRKKIKP